MFCLMQCSEANNSCSPARQRCSSEISDWFRSVCNCQSPPLRHIKLDPKYRTKTSRSQYSSYKWQAGQPGVGLLWHRQMLCKLLYQHSAGTGCCCAAAIRCTGACSKAHAGDTEPGNSRAKQCTLSPCKFRCLLYSKLCLDVSFAWVGGGFYLGGS